MCFEITYLALPRAGQPRVGHTGPQGHRSGWPAVAAVAQSAQPERTLRHLVPMLSLSCLPEAGHPAPTPYRQDSDPQRNIDIWSGCARGSRSSLEHVLRLLDARTGSSAEVRLARPGVLSVRAHVPGGTPGPDLTGLRVLLVADLLARVAELGGLQMLTMLTFSGHSSGSVAALERAADALGVHPPAGRADSRDAQPPLGGAFDVYVGSCSGRVDWGNNGIVMEVGAAQMDQEGNDADVAAGDMLANLGHDPRAIRLALMSFPYNQAVELTASELASAGETLERWRDQVAGWAESPSKPIPSRTVENAHTAFSNVDSVSLLALLRSLELEASVPAGAKFETFAYADRVLGLDLARHIGRPRG